MAAFTNIDIKRRRQLLKMTASDLATAIGCDYCTIYNYESGKCDPSPDVMYQIADAFNDLGIWYDWMRTKYPASYGRLHPEVTHNDMLGSLVSMFSEMADVQDMQRAVLRDAADGRLSEPALRASLTRELEEVLAASQQALNKIKSEKEKKEREQ